MTKLLIATACLGLSSLSALGDVVSGYFTFSDGSPVKKMRVVIKVNDLKMTSYTNSYGFYDIHIPEAYEGYGAQFYVGNVKVKSFVTSSKPRKENITLKGYKK